MTNKVNNKFCMVCGNAIVDGNKFCTKCGTEVGKVESAAKNSVVQGTVPYNKKLNLASQGEPFNYSEYPEYVLTENAILNQMIEKELTNNGVDKKIVTPALEKKKTILTLVYALIIFICFSLYFFRTGRGWIIFIAVISTIVFTSVLKGYNIVKFLEKEIKSRPDEKINYIVSSIVSGKVNGVGSRILRIIVVIVALILPLFIFNEPRLIFEKQDDNYVVRFYTSSLFKSDKVLEIPEEYKGKPVVGIRGDVFANENSIEEIIIPNTVKEIRGGAFKNMSNLEKINIPDGVPEVKGSTFENCYSLKEIKIPDSVTRIGGSAFRENHSLKNVEISENSKLVEIGSSAFRGCGSLKEIYLPKGVSIDQRSFKESPTRVREYSSLGTSIENKFAYNSFLYFNVGEEEKLGESLYRFQDKEAVVKLNKIEVDGNGRSIFVLEYRDGKGKQTAFKITYENRYVVINDSLAFEVKYDYSFKNNSYINSISLNVYYN